MISKDTCLAILDDIVHPVVFVDNTHVIRYLNAPARKRYYDQRGYSELIGKSLFDCHNPASKKQILSIHARLAGGKKEICIGVFRGERIWVVGVSDAAGALIGYYERYDKVETGG